MLTNDEDPDWPGFMASLQCRIPALALHVPDWVPAGDYPAFEDALESVETLVGFADAAMVPALTCSTNPHPRREADEGSRPQRGMSGRLNGQARRCHDRYSQHV